jgi:hypothetical protein
MVLFVRPEEFPIGQVLNLSEPVLFKMTSLLQGNEEE